MIRVKGSEVSFRLTSGKTLALPPRFGILHDAEGDRLPKCTVYFGPFTYTRKHAKADQLSKEYFGDGYDLRVAKIPLPPKDAIWKSAGEAVQIFYYRPGEHEADYEHGFGGSKGSILSLFKDEQKETPVRVSVTKGRRKWYRLELPETCVLNWRGFVFP